MCTEFFDTTNPYEYFVLEYIPGSTTLLVSKLSLTDKKNFGILVYLKIFLNILFDLEA